MLKRNLSLLLSILMLSSVAMTSCSDNGDTEETKKQQTTQTDNTTTEVGDSAEEEKELTELEKRAAIDDNLPDTTFGGKSFIVAATQAKEYEILSEEYTGEATNDAVYDRNLRVSDRFDVKIESYITTNYPYNDVKTVVTSGTYAYDIVSFWNFTAYTPITANVLYNWCDMPNIDLTQPWYNQLANDPATINGKLFAINSDLSISSLQYTYGMFFNQNLWDKYGVSASELYNSVFDGTWTVDKMNSMTSGIWEDTNGDGIHDRDDIHGYSTSLNLNPSDVWLAAFDLDVATINDDGTFEITFFNEKTITALEKAIALTYDPNSYINSDWLDVAKQFAESKVAMTQLYFWQTAEYLGEMEDTYGILPMPKLDETQQNYYTNAWDQFSVFAIPKTITDDSKEMVGTVFAALSAESYKTVFPTYYDQALKSRYSQDRETAEIIDLIMEGRKFEFTFQFGEKLSNLPYMFRYMLASESTDIASTWKKQQKVLNKVFAASIDCYFDED